MLFFVYVNERETRNSNGKFGLCSTHGETRRLFKIFFGKSEGVYILAVLRTAGRIILKLILNKQGKSIRLMWRRIEVKYGLL